MFGKWYQQDYEKAFAGMKAEVSFDVCDSFVSEGGIDAGEAVIRGTNPDTQVKTATASDTSKIIGIAVHTHKDIPENGKYFEDGYNLSVMTFGDIYVLAGGDIEAGDNVDISVDSDGVMSYVKATSGGIAGFTFLDSGAEGDFVRVRIRK